MVFFLNIKSCVVLVLNRGIARLLTVVWLLFGLNFPADSQLCEVSPCHFMRCSQPAHIVGADLKTSALRKNHSFFACILVTLRCRSLAKVYCQCHQHTKVFFKCLINALCFHSIGLKS